MHFYHGLFQSINCFPWTFSIHFTCMFWLSNDQLLHPRLINMFTVGIRYASLRELCAYMARKYDVKYWQYAEAQSDLVYFMHVCAKSFINILLHFSIMQVLEVAFTYNQSNVHWNIWSTISSEHRSLKKDMHSHNFKMNYSGDFNINLVNLGYKANIKKTNCLNKYFYIVNCQYLSVNLVFF